MGKWDVSNVTSMLSMFNGATSFNQDISNWRTRLNENIEQIYVWRMFYNASNFCIKHAPIPNNFRNKNKGIYQPFSRSVFRNTLQNIEICGEPQCIGGVRGGYASWDEKDDTKCNDIDVSSSCGYNTGCIWTGN